MTPQEAMASGKPFKRPGMSDYYTTLTDMSDNEDPATTTERELEALRASDYVVDRGDSEVLSVTSADLVSAWNATRPRGGSVAAAESSEFFRKFKAKLVELSGDNDF